jgi:hypothetical protein
VIVPAFYNGAGDELARALASRVTDAPSIGDRLAPWTVLDAVRDGEGWRAL